MSSSRVWSVFSNPGDGAFFLFFILKAPLASDFLFFSFAAPLAARSRKQSRRPGGAAFREFVPNSLALSGGWRTLGLALSIACNGFPDGRTP
jgi:hypothetical protein